MRQYLLSIYQPKGEGRPEPEFLARVMRDLGVIRQEMEAAGCWVFGQGLHAPDTATVLRPKDGEVLVTDGPFVEGKEYLGGFTILRAPDLDAALEWGRRYALATTLPIEVRPFQGDAGD
ncbi:YciI family protein [Micromonospora sp. LZ34]